MYCWCGQTRAAILTASQLASYSEVKAMTKQLTGWDDGLALHISCSMVAGLVSTTATSPGACGQEHGPVLDERDTVLHAAGQMTYCRVRYFTSAFAPADVQWTW